MTCRGCGTARSPSSSTTWRCTRSGRAAGHPGAPRVEEPNGGSFAFTLGQGGHTLRVVTPDGDEVDYALDMAGDSWLVVHHAKAEDGEGAQTTFDLRRTRSSFDDTYVEEEAPSAPGFARGRTDLTDSRTLPRAAAAPSRRGRPRPPRRSRATTASRRTVTHRPKRARHRPGRARRRVARPTMTRGG